MQDATASPAAARRRPTREEIEPAALDVIRRRGAEILATARRYAGTPEDAEDAYQRALEILLTKAPSTHEDDLVPWLKTVVKHEAFALHKQRERHGTPSEHDELTPSDADTHEHVERIDRLHRGAEALQRLKPQEIRCMVLLAEGYSYKQICEITGFSYTKVNRCLAEGRLSFTQRFAGIESGQECERLAPLISAAADGEASADDLLVLKRHLRGCLTCRAALREARSVPAQVAALTPAAVVATSALDHVHAAWNWMHERLSWFALRGQELMEAAATHKTVAAAASAAALVGGGAATVRTVEQHHPHRQRHIVAAPKPKPKPVVSAPTQRIRAPKPRHTVKRKPAPAPHPIVTAPAAQPPAPPKPVAAPKPTTTGAGEFAP